MTRAFSFRIALLVVIVVGLLAAGLSAFVQSKVLVLGKEPVQVASTPSATTTMGVGVSYVPSGNPTRLIIPAIGVDANVQSVGDWWRDPSVMGIPTNFTDVGWYNKGVRPGEPGSAVVDGHYDGKDVAQAVFYNLQNLKEGDMVEVVDAGGKTLQFSVLAVKLYAADAPTADIFDSDPSHTRLNLITCGGDWVKSEGQYNQRVVVFTELVTSTS